MNSLPQNAQHNWPAVLVGGAYQTGVVLMRNLHRRGLRVSCYDCHADTPGFRTVYGGAFLCPNPDENGEAWLQFMATTAQKLATPSAPKPVLISSADQFVSATAKYSAELARWFTFSPEGTERQAVLATKDHQYDLAAQHGMPVPRSARIESLDDIRAFAETAEFPCLLKPYHYRHWENLPPDHPLHNRKLLLAATAPELIAQYQICASLTPSIVVQEIIQGPDPAKLVYMSCYGKDGRPLGSCLVRQLRTMPIGFGSASIVEPAIDAEADALCDRFLRSIGYSGLCEIELKRDSRDGKIKMIEANPRYSVTADAAPYAGVDLGWLHYLDLIDIPVPEVHPSPKPFRHIVLRRDFATMPSYLKERLLNWRELIWSYRPPVAFFDFDPRDWRVTTTNVSYFARLAGGQILRGWAFGAIAAKKLRDIHL